MREILATIVDPERRRVEAADSKGHLVVMDASPPDGDGLGMSPRAALLAALAGCTAMDVTSILRKKRQRVERYEIAVAGDEATDHPQVFTAIRVEHRFHGAADPEAIRRSVELSATRYCPVSALLSRGVEIEHRYRLTRPDGSEAAALVAVTGPEGSRLA
jgi:putative redox protein